jgi:hypothetical protein
MFNEETADSGMLANTDCPWLRAIAPIVAVAWQTGRSVMARKYSKAAGAKVGRALHEMKRGTLTSGRSQQRVKNPKQAVAIGLAEARREGSKVPKKRTG